MKKSILFLTLLVIALLAVNGCQSLKTFTKKPEQYRGDNNFNYQSPAFDASRKNIFIVANTATTELFDMIAPYYLFNATGKANVYIVAERKSPIQIKNNLYVLPQVTFDEVDALNLQADVIVIPFLGVIDTNQNPVIVKWIKNHYKENTKVLSICDGAATAAATGLYDGKPLTCHASDYAILTPNFNKPLWVQQVSVTHSGNLYSTAGVSNAVEGSLLVIHDLFGRATMEEVMASIHYRYPEIRLEHQSIAIDTKDKITIIKKVFFRKNRNVGVLLQDGANELQLASILDTYGRTFPARLEAHVLNGKTVKTKYGLTLVATQHSNLNALSELHVIDPEALSTEEVSALGKTDIVRYTNAPTGYPIDICVKRIAAQYGSKFASVSKIMLDYN